MDSSYSEKDHDTGSDYEESLESVVENENFLSPLCFKIQIDRETWEQIKPFKKYI